MAHDSVAIQVAIQVAVQVAVPIAYSSHFSFDDGRGDVEETTLEEKHQSEGHF